MALGGTTVTLCHLIEFQRTDPQRRLPYWALPTAHASSSSPPAACWQVLLRGLPDLSLQVLPLLRGAVALPAAVRVRGLFVRHLQLAPHLCRHQPHVRAAADPQRELFSHEPHVWYSALPVRWSPMYAFVPHLCAVAVLSVSFLTSHQPQVWLL